VVDTPNWVSSDVVFTLLATGLPSFLFFSATRSVDTRVSDSTDSGSGAGVFGWSSALECGILGGGSRTASPFSRLFSFFASSSS